MSKSTLFSHSYKKLITMTALASVLAFQAFPCHSNDLAIELIAKYEQCKEHIYRDAGGHKTIGYGFKNPKVSKMSCNTAKNILRQKVHELDKELSTITHNKPIDHKRRAAIISLMYNIGSPNFRKSRIPNLIKNDQWGNIKQSWVSWSYVKGKRLSGLKNRRIDEASLF